MSENKKTEEQIRHEIRRKFNFSEEHDEERINTAVEMEKDRYKAVNKKQELKKELAKSDKPAGTKDPAGKKEGVNPNYSLKDIRALSKVADEDLDKVTNYAEKFHNGSAHEAMKDKDLGAILKNRAEERKSANASSTGSGKRGSGKISGAKLLEKASATGKLPETDAEMDALLEERYKPRA